MGAIEAIGDDWMATGEFFAPAASDLVSGLMGEYRRARGCAARLAPCVARAIQQCVSGRERCGGGGAGLKRYATASAVAACE